MFATPRADSSRANGARGARRALEWSNSGQTRQRPRSHVQNQLNSEDESPIPGNVDQETPGVSGGNEMLTILRHLQQQVSALQAQQNRVMSERTSSTPTSTATTPSGANEKRKLPKELTVSMIGYDVF